MANLEFRKKAMNKMMSDKPSVSVMKKKKPPMMEAMEKPDMEEMPMMKGEEEDEESEGEFESMMVTPEEKALIEKLRAKAGMSEYSEDEESESEYE